MDAESRTAAKGHNGVAQGEELVVLVAEDNDTNRDLLARQLTRLGYRCELASSALEALERWRGGRYALLLTDLRMPSMDGFALAAAIRAEETAAGPRLPIIAISADAYDEHAERCIESGMDGYLPKPVELKLLRATLERWLAGTGNAATEADDGSTLPEDEPPRETLPPGDESPVDPGVLEDLVGDDPDAVMEILLDFVRHARESADALVAAAHTDSAGAVCDAAHKLKSSARGVGAHALADLCQLLERAGEREDWDTIAAGMSGLADRVRAVEVYVGRC